MSSSTVLSCPFIGSPPLNSDIAGIGVRISIYVQSLLTVVFLTVSPDISDVYNQCFPYVMMNIAVMLAALVLGFSSKPQISLQDALVAWFFTFIPLFVLMIAGQKLANRNKLYNAMNSSRWDLIPNIVSFVVMWTLHAAFSLSLFRHYKTFGSTPECNGAARAFIFGTILVTNRWFIGLAVAYGIVLSAIYFSLLWRLCLFVGILCSARKPRNEEERKKSKAQGERFDKLVDEATPEANFQADYTSGFIAFSLLAIWITFTEVTVVKNNFAPANSPAWQFGQIFPMILLAVPVLATTRAVSEFVQDTPARRERMMQDPPPEERLGLLSTLDKIMDVPTSPIVPSDSVPSPATQTTIKLIRGVGFAIGYAIGLLNLLWIAIVFIVGVCLTIGTLLGITAVMGMIMMLAGNAILRAHWDHYSDDKSAAAIGATGACFAGLIVVVIIVPFTGFENPKLPWLVAVLITVVFSTLTGTIGSKILLHYHVALGAIDCLHATRAGAVGGAVFSWAAGFVLPLILSPLFGLVSLPIKWARGERN